MADSRSNLLTLGGGLGFLGVLAGTFGAHGLEGVITEPKALEWWDTAVQYHLVHALALVLAAVVARGSDCRAARGAGWCFLAGTAIFSGTLYAMALGGPRWLGMVTPVGGVLFLVGWAMLARARTAQ